MKKFIKVISIIATVCLVLGIILAGIGFVLGGSGFSIGRNMKINKESCYVYENMDMEKFSNIDISSYDSKVEVLKSEDGKYGVSVIFYNKDAKHSVKVENGTLVVKEGKTSGNISFDFGAVFTDYYVKVYVPSDVSDVVVNTSNGSITIKDITTGKEKLNTSNGSITVDAVCSSLEAKTSNGSINVNVPGCDTKLTTSNGKITFATDSAENDYNMTANTSNGSIIINSKKMSGSYECKNNGKYNLILKTSNGSINVTTGK